MQGLSKATTRKIKCVTQRKMKIGEILVRQNLIDNKTLRRALLTQRITRTPLGKILVEGAQIDHLDLNRALLEQNWRAQGMWVI